MICESFAFRRKILSKWAEETARRIRSDNSSGTRCMYMRITLTSTPTKEPLERKACQSGWAWHANMIQESETRRNARTYAGVADRAEWSSDENGARVHRFRGREGIDEGLGQVRVEQIYWIQGGCKSGGISVTKERYLLVYWEPEWKKNGEGREGGSGAKKEKHGDRRWKRSHSYSIGAPFICWRFSAGNVLYIKTGYCKDSRTHQMFLNRTKERHANLIFLLYLWKFITEIFLF